MKCKSVVMKKINEQKISRKKKTWKNEKNEKMRNGKQHLLGRSAF